MGSLVDEAVNYTGFCQECGRPIRMLFGRWFHLEARDTRFCSAPIVTPRPPKIEDVEL